MRNGEQTQTANDLAAVGFSVIPQTDQWSARGSQCTATLAAERKKKYSCGNDGVHANQPPIDRQADSLGAPARL